MPAPVTRDRHDGRSAVHLCVQVIAGIALKARHRAGLASAAEARSGEGDPAPPIRYVDQEHTTGGLIQKTYNAVRMPALPNGVNRQNG